MVSGTLPWLLIVLSAVVGTIGAPLPTVVARLWFVCALGGAVVAALAVVGPRAQTVAGSLLLVLALGQSAVQRTIPEPPSSQWTVALRTPAERIRHTIALPVGTAEWNRWWSRATGAAAYVCARGPLAEVDGLDLFAGDQHLARITQSEAIGPRPQPTSVGFYRVPIERTLLESGEPLVLELRRAPDAAPRPLEICGTFTYRPTAGIESSTFFDGLTWKSPGMTRRGRFLIELRIEEGEGRAVAALY